jgi:hypothetical protein
VPPDDAIVIVRGGPIAAEKIVESFGEAWPPVWPSTDSKAELTRLEPGRAVGVPPVLVA